MPSTVIPFPGAVTAIGETFPSAVVAAGIQEAAQRGVTRPQVDALLRYDRRLTLYWLGRLGDGDSDLRCYGAVGLDRLLTSMERDVR